MNKKYFLICISVVLMMFLGACSLADDNKNNEKSTELTVSAAASLKDTLEEIKIAYEKEHPAIKINFNLGSSGALQQQISQGAPADLFISAGEDKFDILEKEKMLLKKVDLVGNEVVLIVPKSEGAHGISAFKDLHKASKISIGTPETVPAGEYAAETLKSLQMWGQLEGKLVYAKDVRQVLTYVETGNVEAGVVYQTDAKQSSKVKIVETASSSDHSPIIYPAGIISSTKHKKESQSFYQFLQGEKAMSIFKKYGFKDLN
jgi:molybdate transport system substrate-binding protein